MDAKINACVRCGRALKNPESMVAGMGPTCRAKAEQSSPGELLGDTPVLVGVPPITEAGLICRRLENGTAAANVPHIVRYHSPTGFEWGYPGSGPAELALNALHALLPPGRDGWPCTYRMNKVRGDNVLVTEHAERLHQEFKWRFIANIPKEGGHVPLAQIDQFLAEHGVIR